MEEELRIVKQKYEAVELDLKREKEEAWAKEVKAGTAVCMLVFFCMKCRTRVEICHILGA
jgi:hypothetical protein